MGPVQFSWPRGVAENWFTKSSFWEHFVGFPEKNSKTQSSLNFLHSGPRKFTKSHFSGLAPIRWVLRFQGVGASQPLKWNSGELSGHPISFHCSWELPGAISGFWGGLGSLRLWRKLPTLTTPPPINYWENMISWAFSCIMLGQGCWVDSRPLYCRTPEKWSGGWYSAKWFGFPPESELQPENRRYMRPNGVSIFLQKRALN